MIILSITAIFLFGYLLSGLFLEEKLERLSLSFILGLGVFTLCWFLLNLVGIPFTLFSGLGLVTILSIILFGLSKLIHRKKEKKTEKSILAYFKNMDLTEKVFVAVVIFLFLSSILGDLYWPVRHWDSLTLYDFRARIFAEIGFMTKAISDGGFFGYPLLTSLSHTLVYLSGFANPSFIYSFFYMSFVINVFVNLKKLKVERVLVLFLTLLIAVSPRIFDHSLTAYTNLPYLTYLVLGSIYLYFGIKNKNIGSFVLSAILIGLSTWTRSAEPFWLSCVLVAIIYSLINKKWLWPIFYILSLASIMLPWRYFQASYQQGTANVAGQIVSASYIAAKGLQFAPLKATFDFVKTNVIYAYMGLFVLLALMLVYKLVKKSTEWLLFSLVILNLGLVFAGTLVFVRSILYWQDIPDSLSRMIMFLPPLIIFLSGELLSEIKRR
jgi:hypothetical protein